MKDNEPGDQLGWRRAELLLTLPPLAIVVPAFLDSVAGPGLLVAMSGLLAPFVVPGRRACGQACVIAGSGYAVLSVLGTLFGLILFLPSAVILALVGAGYLNPGWKPPRVLAWLALLATMTAATALMWPYLFPARDTLRVVARSPGSVTWQALAAPLWKAGMDVVFTNDCHGNLYVEAIGTSARDRERAIALVLAVPGVRTADWSIEPDC